MSAFKGFALLVTVLGLAVGCARRSGPAIDIQPSSLDLGTVRNEDGAVRTFHIRNVGDEPLALAPIEFGCGCTQAEVPASLGPGESADIRLSYLPDPTWSGTRAETATIRSSDRQNPEVTLQVKATLDPPLRVHPAANQLVAFVPGQPATATFRLEPRADKAAVYWAKLAVPSANVHMEANVVQVKIGSLSTGDHTLVIPLKTSLGPLDLHLLFQASSGPVSNPEQIDVGHLDRTGKLLDLLVYTRYGLLRSVVVTPDSPHLVTSVEPAGKAYRVRVDYDGGFAPGIHSGSLSIATDQGDLKVPYRLAIR